MPGEIALDSNIIVDWLAGNKIYEARLRDYGSVYLPAPVIGELIYGALISTQVERNLERITRIVSESITIHCDLGTAEVYASIKASLKKSGKPIPEADIRIGACCLQHKVPLATRDSNFNHVQGLEIEKW